MCIRDRPYSESTAEKIDLAIKNILDEGHKVATDIINTHRDTHRLIAEALLKYETLNEKQILSLFKTGKMPEENDYPSEKDALNYEETKEALKRKEDKFLESDSEDQKGSDDAEDSEDPKTND